MPKKKSKTIQISNTEKIGWENSKTKGIRIEGEYVIWPESGLRTHLRFIKEAVMKRRNLPVGFYDEAKRLNLPNLNVLAARGKSLGLKDNVGK